MVWPAGKVVVVSESPFGVPKVRVSCVVLDEDCLPDSGWEISAGRAFYFPGDGHEHAGYRNGRELAHYDPNDGTRVKAGSQTAISGIAWDGGYGIRSVEISADNGETWATARLGEDLGKFAFRPWNYDFAPKVRGKLSLTARATNKISQTQPQGR